VDIVKGRAVPLDSGALYRAVRSSISIPVVFPPVPLNETFMVDGGLLNNNPVDLALDAGADIVIDVDVGSFMERTNEDIDALRTVVDLTIRFVQSKNLASPSASAHEEYRLVMDLHDFSVTDFAQSQQLIDRGEEIARQKENWEALESLAAAIEKSRPLEKRDWRRRGAYHDISVPVFTRVRLESISTAGRTEDEQAVRKEFPQKYLDALFGKMVNAPVDFSKLETTIEIVRRRGNYENMGYRLLTEEDGGCALVLTGIRAVTRKNSVSLSMNASYMQNARSYIGLNERVDLALRDVFLPRSFLRMKFAYDFTDVQGPTFSASYGKELSPVFQAEARADAAYYTTSIQAFNHENELSSFGYFSAAARLTLKPADLFSLSLSYRYTPLWYTNEPSVFGDGAGSSSYFGDLHSAVFEIDFDTINITRPLFFTLLYNVDWRASVEFPFAGSRLSTAFPWYERLEFFGRKAWVPRPRSNFIFDINFASYLGELKSRWSFFSPVGKDGVPGYSSLDILRRNKLTLGMTYLEEIVPFSNKLNMRTFFALAARGGSFWEPLDSRDQFAASWIGGVRTGVQIETPIGMLFAGPAMSFDGKFVFCVYFN
jgi:hypothetical protein